MSKLVETHIACPCGQSSDGYCKYDDGHGWCFACSKYFAAEGDQEFNDLTQKTFQTVPWRGISREAMEKYNVRTEVQGETPVAVYFSYPNGRTQVRKVQSKEFKTIGELTSERGYLFGSDVFPAGSAKAVTVCEGAIDALSVFEMMGRKYPVVSVTSASTAKKDCTKDYEYLNSFDKIYLCFDSDEPGQTAVNAVAEMFDFNKIYHVKLDKKDPNEYLVAGDTDTFHKVWWAAKRFLPEGIVSTFAEMGDIIDKDQKKESVPYPFAKLNEQTYGLRTGEIVLVKAMEGIGKTEILRAIEYDLLKNTKENIGILHLEENKARSLKGLVGYELQQPCHLPDSQVSNADIKKTLQKLVGTDDRLHIYTHFGSDDPDTILNTIRFMAGACGCKYIFLDHITMVVTGLHGEDERRALDYISTRLAMMTQELDFGLIMVSHVNDNGQTRGSRNISKVASLILSLHRDITAETAELRNITRLTIEKNRYASKTGPSSRLKFDEATFMITEEESFEG